MATETDHEYLEHLAMKACQEVDEEIHTYPYEEQKRAYGIVVDKHNINMMTTAFISQQQHLEYLEEVLGLLKHA